VRYRTKNKPEGWPEIWLSGGTVQTLISDDGNYISKFPKIRKNNLRPNFSVYVEANDYFKSELNSNH
jgi:hypothetical protein